MQLFWFYGLRICSELDLALPVAPDGRADVDLLWGSDIHDSRQTPPGDLIASYELPDRTWYSATDTGDGYRFRFHGCGEFTVSRDLRQVRARRDPEGDAAMLPILFVGTVGAFLLTLRGATVMHASAVCTGGSALAFVGQSGRGKSTIAAMLCGAGASLVTDDVLIVDRGDPVMCQGGASELRLRPNARPLVRTLDTTDTYPTADDRVAVSPSSVERSRVPLAAIVVPTPSRTARRVEFAHMPPSTALFAILSFPRVHGWRVASVLERDFATLSHLVSTVPVFEAAIPWGPPFDPRVAPALLSLASDYGSRTRAE